MAKHNITGEIGENIASNFLTNKCFNVVCRNYRKKWGEIDVIAEKDKVLHFVEVKTVSRRSFGPTSSRLAGLRGTSVFEQEVNNYRPEDNMHPWKLKRMSRTIQTYLLSEKISEDKEWQVDLLVVYLDLKNKKARVKVVSDIIL